jgi:hypothetical protein
MLIRTYSFLLDFRNTCFRRQVVERQFTHSSVRLSVSDVLRQLRPRQVLHGRLWQRDA